VLGADPAGLTALLGDLTSPPLALIFFPSTRSKIPPPPTPKPKKIPRGRVKP
jgi:hypothetical protein